MTDVRQKKTVMDSIGIITTNKEGETVMKKRISAILMSIFLMLAVFSACTEEKKHSQQSKNILTYSNSQQQETVSHEKNEKTEITTKVSTEQYADNDGAGGGLLTVKKYRSRYYSIPSTFVDLVGRDVYYEWIYTVDHTDKAEKMLMPQFIQSFGITREQFDKANLEFARIIRDNLNGRPCINPKDYANQISDEIFNGDIVFTFDDEIINEYYLSPEYPYLYSFEFDEAVENGTYTAQTEEWVDVEQMEAEINAKYGAPEVTETTTAIPEETQVTE